LTLAVNLGGPGGAISATGSPWGLYEGKEIMRVLGLLALSTTSDETTRLILLLLMVLAVLLIITGCVIALITWRKRIKAHNAYSDTAQWDKRT